MSLNPESRYTLVLEGTITAEQPLATAPPTPQNQQKPDVQTLPRMPLPTAQDTAIMTPYFPGGGLRGILRRRAFDEVRSRGDAFTLRDYNYIVIGGVKGRKEDPNAAEDKNDLLKVMRTREHNPLIGLFGAGDPWATGCLGVGHAIPQSPVTPVVVTGVRRDDFARGGEELKILSPEEQARWVRTAQNNSERSKLTTAIQALQADLGVAGAKRRGKKVELTPEATEAKSAELARLEKALGEVGETVSTTSVQLPLAGYEVIPAGTRLDQRLVLRDARVQEIGLFLRALGQFAFNPYVGSKFAHGCGLISGEWNAVLTESLTMKRQALGTVRLTPFEEIGMDPTLQAAVDHYVAKADAGEFRYNLD